MNFTNVSQQTNARITQEAETAVKNKKPNRQIIAALLAASAEVDPLAAKFAALDTSLSVSTRSTITCSFLSGSEKKPEVYSKADLADYPPFGSILDGADAHTLFVLQSEYAVIVPPMPTALSPGLHVSSSSSTSVSPVAYIGSPDATSCLVLAARAHVKGAPSYVSATALGHFDRDGGDLIEGVRGMYYKALLPAIADQFRVYRAERAKREEEGKKEKENQSEEEESSSSLIAVEWYFVGGMINDQHTLPCISDLIAHFMLPLFDQTSLAVQAAMVGKFSGKTAGTFAIEHSLRPDGQCFWSLNTYRDLLGRHTCNIRGMRINALDGSSEPFEIRANKRGYPFPHVRGTRFASRSLEEGAILSLCPRPADGLRKMRFTSVEPSVPSGKSRNNGPVFELDFTGYLQAMRRAISAGEPMPVVVPAAYLDDVPKEYASITVEQAARMSTTPHCEPIDFAPRLAKNFHYAAQATTAGVFGEPPLPITNFKLD